MTFNFNNKYGEVASFGCDFIPGVGTAKGVYEGFLRVIIYLKNCKKGLLKKYRLLEEFL